MKSARVLYAHPLRAEDFAHQETTRIKSRVIAEDSVVKWYQVASVTDMTRNGHPLTRRFLELFVESFYAMPEPGPVYRGHADYDPFGFQVEEPPAAGWVLALELADDGKLWAAYELTERLYEQITAGEFRFNSIYAFVDIDEDGNETAVDFVSIAVTNKPAVSNLKPMAATWRARRLMEKTMPTDVELIKAALKELGDDATLDQITEWVAAKKVLDGIKSGEGAGTGEGGEVPASTKPKGKGKRKESTDGEGGTEERREEAPPPGEGDAEAAAATELLALAKAVGEKAGMDLAGVIAAMRDRIDDFAAWLKGGAGSGTPADATALSRRVEPQSASIVTLTDRVTKAEARVVELEAEKTAREKAAKKTEAEAVVAEHIKLGKILPAQKDFWTKIALSDRKDFDAQMATMPPVVPTERVAADDTPPNEGESDESDLLKARDDAEKSVLKMSVSDRAKKSAIKNHRARKAKSAATK